MSALAETLGNEASWGRMQLHIASAARRCTHVFHYLHHVVFLSRPCLYAIRHLGRRRMAPSSSSMPPFSASPCAPHEWCALVCIAPGLGAQHRHPHLQSHSGCANLGKSTGAGYAGRRTLLLGFVRPLLDASTPQATPIALNKVQVGYMARVEREVSPTAGNPSPTFCHNPLSRESPSDNLIAHTCCVICVVHCPPGLREGVGHRCKFAAAVMRCHTVRLAVRPITAVTHMPMSTTLQAGLLAPAL